MSLVISASSTDTDYTTTGALKALLNTTSTVRDAYMSDVIRRASRWADNYIGTPMLLQSYQETVAGYGTRTLMLNRTPIRAVRRLFDSTDTGTGTQVLSSEFRVEDTEAGLISRKEGFNWTPRIETGSFDAVVPLSLTPRPGQEDRPWLVDYVAGWSYNGVATSSPNWSTELGTTSTGRTLPEDVEEAVLYKAQELYQGGSEVASESLGDLSVNYRSLGTDASGGVITRAKEILDVYRRIV